MYSKPLILIKNSVIKKGMSYVYLMLNTIGAYFTYK